MSAYSDQGGGRIVASNLAAAPAAPDRLGRLQRRTLAAIRAAGPRGLTALEAAAVTGFDRLSIQPRVSELRRKALIRNSGQRRPNPSGRHAIVWVAV